MENPKSVHRFLLALVGVCTVAALGLSIYCRDFYIFLGWLATLALLFVVCGVLALFNVAMFAPIFWLIGRLADRRARKRNQRSDEHVL
jgi:hypothetical protein